jgi:hypothetical protein
VAPAVDAPAPAPAVESKPPASTQPPLNASEAARLLGQRRQELARQNAAEAPPAPRPQRTTAPQAPPAANDGAPAESTPSSYETLAKALGLEPGTLPPSSPGANDGVPPPGSAANANFEYEGQRYTAEQLQSAIRQTRDYTQKTMALADAQRALTEKESALATVLQVIGPEYRALQQRIQDVPTPDQSLVETNPQEYLRQFAAYNAAQADRARLGQMDALQRQAFERHISSQVEAGNKVLAEKYDFWRDDATRSSVQRDIANWALSKGGYSRQELLGVADPKHVETMMKAMMFDQMVDGAKTTRPVQPTAAPARGAAPPPPPAQRVADAEKAFTDTPNLRNAVSLLGARRQGGNGRY